MSKRNYNQILITIGSFDETLSRVKRAVKRIEAGLPPDQPVHRLTFTSQTHLFKTLSPKRMDLIRFLKKQGPLSCRQLSIKLRRAYANVHDDIKSLLLLGLVKKDSDSKLFVPWDEINISLKLAA